MRTTRSRLHPREFWVVTSSCLLLWNSSSLAFVPSSSRPSSWRTTGSHTNSRQWVQTYNVDSAKTDNDDEEEFRKKITSKYADIYQELVLNNDDDEDLLSADEVEEVSILQKRIEKDEKELLKIIKQEESLEVPTFDDENENNGATQKAAVATLEKKTQTKRKKKKKDESRFTAMLDEKEQEEEDETSPIVLEEVEEEEGQGIQDTLLNERKKTPIILGATASQESLHEEAAENTPIILEAAATDSNGVVAETSTENGLKEHKSPIILGAASSETDSVVSDMSTPPGEEENSTPILLESTEIGHNGATVETTPLDGERKEPIIMGPAVVESASTIPQEAEKKSIQFAGGALKTKEDVIETSLEEDSHTEKAPVMAGEIHEETTTKTISQKGESEVKEVETDVVSKEAAATSTQNSVVDEILDDSTKEAKSQPLTMESIALEEEIKRTGETQIVSVERTADKALEISDRNPFVEVLPLKKVTVRQPFWAGTTYRDISDSLVQAVTPRDSVEELWCRDGVDLLLKTTAHLTSAAVATGKVAYFATEALGEALADEEVKSFASEAGPASRLVRSTTSGRSVPPLRKIEAIGSTCASITQCLRSSRSTGRAIEAMADTARSLVSAVASAAVGGIKSATNAKGLLRRMEEEFSEKRVRLEQQWRERENRRQEQRLLESKRKLVEECVKVKQDAAEATLNQKLREDLRIKLEKARKAQKKAADRILESTRLRAEHKRQAILEKNSLAIKSLEESLEAMESQYDHESEE